MFVAEYLLVCIQVTLSVTIDYRTTIQPYGFNMCRTFCQRVVGCKSFLYQASELRCQCDTSSPSSGSEMIRFRHILTQNEHGLFGCMKGSLVIKTKFTKFCCLTCSSAQNKTHTDMETRQSTHSNRYSKGKDVCKELMGYVTLGRMIEAENIIKQYENHKKCKQGPSKMNALMVAARNARIEMFDLLRVHGYSLEDWDGIGDNVLHNAAMSCNIDMVQHILKQGSINVYSLGFNDYTPLMLSVTTCTYSMAMLRFFVQKGSDLNARTYLGFNVLHAASCAGNMEVIRFILDNASIKVNDQQRYGITSYMYAHLMGQREVEKFLISKNCKTSMTHVFRNIGHDCEGRFQTIALKALEALGQNYKKFDYKTLYIIAALDHNIEVIQYIQRRKACNTTGKYIDIGNDLRNRCRKPAFKWLPIIKVFGIYIIDFRMSDDTECFMTAVKSRRKSVVQFLRSYGGVVKK